METSATWPQNPARTGILVLVYNVMVRLEEAHFVSEGTDLELSELTGPPTVPRQKIAWRDACVCRTS